MSERYDEFDPVADTDRQDAVVEVVVGIVQGAPAGARSIAQPDIAARFNLQHVGKVFRGHRRLAASTNLVRAADGLSGRTTQFRFLDTIDRRRVARIELDTDLRAIRLADPGTDAFDRTLDEILHRRLETANRAAQHGVVGNDVERVAAVNLRHAYDRRLARVQVARHHRLQCDHQMAGDYQRVDALIGHRRVAAVPTDGDLEGAGAGHDRPRHHGHLADGQARPVVQPEHRPHRKLLEQSVLDHYIATGFRLFRRLEDEIDGTIEIKRCLILRDVARRPEKQRGVTIVPAGVHPARMRGNVGKVILFLQRQGIHIRAQADRARARPFAQHTNDAGPGQSAMYFDAIRSEFARHNIRRTRLLIGEFGMGVQVAAQRRQFGKEGDFKQGHISVRIETVRLVYACPACR